MTKDEALRLALEALKAMQMYAAAEKKGLRICDEAIIAAEEALAQPEQEPVATDWERIARVQDAKLRAMCDEKGGFEKLCEVMDKYERTTPPQRTWVGLTDEEIWDLHIKMSVALNCKLSDLIEFAKATEAKLKEKNT